MSVWQAHTGDDGRVYYFNTVTNESSWEKPDELLTPLEKALAKSKWKEYTAEGGAKYWYNEETEESVWDIPEEINTIIQNLSEEEKSAIASSADPIVASATINQHGVPFSAPLTETFKYTSESAIAPGKLPIIENQEEKLEAFKSMLKDHAVSKDQKWPSVMKLLIKDPRYWAISEPLERKRIFDQYSLSLKIELAEKKKKIREEQFSEMVRAFSNFPEIKYYTRWKTVKSKVLSDPIFQNFIEENIVKYKGDREKDGPRLVHAAFNQYVRGLRDTYEANKKREQQLAIKKLTNILETTLKVSANSSWTDTYNQLKESPKFNEDSLLSGMSKNDILAAYSDFIRIKDREFNAERQAQKKLQRRKERKIREAFVQVLEELHNKGYIKAGAKWTEVRPLLENKQEYIEICGQPGSTPLELFWDIVEEESRKLKLQREQVIDLITAKKFAVNNETSFESFKEFVESSLNALNSNNKEKSENAIISPSNLEAIFEDIKASEAKRKEMDRHADERRIRRLQDGLRAALHEIEPPIKPGDKWEDVEKLVQNTEEYIKLKTPELRREAFDKYMRRLQERIQEREQRSKEREQKDRDRLKEREEEERRRKTPLRGALPYGSSDWRNNGKPPAPPPPPPSSSGFYGYGPSSQPFLDY